MSIDFSLMLEKDTRALARIEALTPRFWQKVRRSACGCWQWTGATNGSRGHIRVARVSGLAINIVAPRLSWLIHYGPIPYGLLVCHRCDNPRCVRPDHLMLGTPRFNVRDMIDKGRAAWQQFPREALAANGDLFALESEAA